MREKYRLAERKVFEEAVRRGDDVNAAIQRERTRAWPEKRRDLLAVYAKYGFAPPPEWQRTQPPDPLPAGGY